MSLMYPTSSHWTSLVSAPQILLEPENKSHHHPHLQRHGILRRGTRRPLCPVSIVQDPRTRAAHGSLGAAWRTRGRRARRAFGFSPVPARLRRRGCPLPSAHPSPESASCQPGARRRSPPQGAGRAPGGAGAWGEGRAPCSPRGRRFGPTRASAAPSRRSPSRRAIPGGGRARRALVPGRPGPGFGSGILLGAQGAGDAALEAELAPSSRRNRALCLGGVGREEGPRGGWEGRWSAALVAGYSKRTGRLVARWGMGSLVSLPVRFMQSPVVVFVKWDDECKHVLTPSKSMPGESCGARCPWCHPGHMPVGTTRALNN